MRQTLKLIIRYPARDRFFFYVEQGRKNEADSTSDEYTYNMHLQLPTIPPSLATDQLLRFISWLVSKMYNLKWKIPATPPSLATDQLQLRPVSDQQSIYLLLRPLWQQIQLQLHPVSDQQSIYLFIYLPATPPSLATDTAIAPPSE